MNLVVAQRFAGPPSMGHGGFVAGLFAAGVGGAVQVTLRRPTPLDAPLALDRHDDGRGELRHGDELIAAAEPAALTLTTPTPPHAVDAAAAEAGSPSHRNGRGVHPTCFGCGVNREVGDALRIAAGPIEVDGIAQVAAAWLPGPDGTGGFDPSGPAAAAVMATGRPAVSGEEAEDAGARYVGLVTPP